MAAIYEPPEGKTLRIAHWEETHELDKARGLGSISWVCIPVKLDGDGYTELIDHPRGGAHYGAWMATLCIAARCPKRGLLARGLREILKRPNKELKGPFKPNPIKTPIKHDSATIARISRQDPVVVGEALARLVSIGWLDFCDDLEVCEALDFTLLNGHLSASRARAKGKERKGKERKHSQPLNKDGGGSAALFARVQAEWQLAAERSQLRPAIRLSKARRERLDYLFATDPVFEARWQESIARAAGSDFCNGGGPRGWVMTFDSWLKHWADVLEGKYDDRDQAAGSDSAAVLDKLEQEGRICGNE